MPSKWGKKHALENSSQKEPSEHYNCTETNNEGIRADKSALNFAQETTSSANLGTNSIYCAINNFGIESSNAAKGCSSWTTDYR